MWVSVFIVVASSIYVYIYTLLNTINNYENNIILLKQRNSKLEKSNLLHTNELLSHCHLMEQFKETTSLVQKTCEEIELFSKQLHNSLKNKNIVIDNLQIDNQKLHVDNQKLQIDNQKFREENEVLRSKLISYSNANSQLNSSIIEVKDNLSNALEALEIYKNLKHSYEVVIKMLDTPVYYTAKPESKQVTLSNIYYSTDTHYISDAQRKVLSKCVNYYNSHKHTEYRVCDCCAIEPH